MFSKNIPLNTMDFTGKRSDNLVEGEYYRRLDTSTINGRYEGFKDITFIPRTGPFYIDSMVLTRPNGELLIEGTHYEFFGIATALTAFVKDKEVGIFINMIDEDVTEWFASYQVVGHFGILNQDLVNIVNTAVDDDRPVYYKDIRNKPKWFNPELHLHDLRWGIHSFQDLVDGIKSIATLKSNLTPRASIAIEHFNSVIMSHIEDFESMLLSYIRTHDNENVAPYGNSHGLTAKQVELEKVDNFETATLLQIIDGFRRDKHVTVDLVKKAIDYYGVADDNLIKYGTLPILRYGSNSFIPVPISGSYEGMGSADFFFGTNIESNGDSLILMNRNDGRVNGLYFMENKTKGAPPDTWSFTSYAYEHQTANADGVSLTKIIRGSNGKFLIVGGPNSSNKLTWYYSLGNGTLNPDKHILTKFPDALQNALTFDSFICTSAYPSRIILCIPFDQPTVWKDSTLRAIGYSSPVQTDTVEGVIFNNGAFMGQWMWEFDIPTKTWRQITFNYSQAYGGDNVTSTAWIPYKYIIQETTANNPRADGENLKYGLKQGEFIFSKLISCWHIRRWIDVNLDKYDEATDRIAMKYHYTPYGYDSRTALFDGYYSSIGFILKNRVISGNSVIYTVENRKGLVNPTSIDTTVAGSNVSATHSGAMDHAEWVARGWVGYASYCWLSNGKIMAAGTQAYGTFPMEIKTADFSGVGSFENFDNFANAAFNENLGSATVPQLGYLYNEQNPANLTIGGHSTFWLQLDPNNPNTYGSVNVTIIKTTASDSGLWFRLQPALDANGYAKIPSKTFTLYKNDGAGGKTTYGYDLSNTTYQIDNPMGEVFCTNIFANVSNNRKAEYLKNIIAHHSYKGDMVIGNYYSSDSTADYIFKAEWEVQKISTVYKIVPTKQYNLESQIRNVLLPKIKAAGAGNTSLNYAHSLSAHRISYTNLIGTKYDKFLIFTVPVVDTSTGYLYSYSVAFNLTGGTADSSGIIQNAIVTPVGNVVNVLHLEIRSDQIASFITEGASIVRYVNTPYTQPRDLVMQLSTGKSMVVIQMPTNYPVKGNRNEIGIACLIDETGIVNVVEKSVYYTAGQYKFFHHPYYGLVNRVFSPGPSEVGYPLKDPTAFDFAQDTTKFILGNSNYLDGAFTVYFSSVQEVLLNGRKFTVPSAIKNLQDVISDPKNKTFYVYLDYNEEGAYYNISLTPIAESPSRALISIIKTNNDSIYSIDNYNVLSMNGIRISAVRHGSVIPAATGAITSQGQLEGWVTKNRS